MNLNNLAESDLQYTLEDIDNGFGVNLTLIDDKLSSYDVVGNTNDIGFFIDIQSGAGVIGRRVEISIRISTLTSLGAGYPKQSWKVIYTDTNDNEWQMYIAQAPKTDRKLGIYTIVLEVKK